jgi:hypothetical protein
MDEVLYAFHPSVMFKTAIKAPRTPIFHDFSDLDSLTQLQMNFMLIMMKEKNDLSQLNHS